MDTQAAVPLQPPLSIRIVGQRFRKNQSTRAVVRCSGSASQAGCFFIRQSTPSSRRRRLHRSWSTGSDPSAMHPQTEGVSAIDTQIRRCVASPLQTSMTAPDGDQHCDGTVQCGAVCARDALPRSGRRTQPRASACALRWARRYHVVDVDLDEQRRRRGGAQSRGLAAGPRRRGGRAARGDQSGGGSWRPPSQAACHARAAAARGQGRTPAFHGVLERSVSRQRRSLAVPASPRGGRGR
jgi:hypothetical protein